jgi:hypothetical protein
MKKEKATKTVEQKISATTLQAGALNNQNKPQDRKSANWDRYVDSRLKQFCLR